MKKIVMVVAFSRKFNKCCILVMNMKTRVVSRLVCSDSNENNGIDYEYVNTKEDCLAVGYIIEIESYGRDHTRVYSRDNIIVDCTVPWRYIGKVSKNEVPLFMPAKRGRGSVHNANLWFAQQESFTDMSFQLAEVEKMTVWTYYSKVTQDYRVKSNFVIDEKQYLGIPITDISFSDKALFEYAQHNNKDVFYIDKCSIMFTRGEKPFRGCRYVYAASVFVN